MSTDADAEGYLAHSAARAFRHRFHQLLVESGYTYEDVVQGLANQNVTTSQATLSNIRHGRRTPRLDLVCGLARVFGVPASSFLPADSPEGEELVQAMTWKKMNVHEMQLRTVSEKLQTVTEGLSGDDAEQLRGTMMALLDHFAERAKREGGGT